MRPTPIALLLLAVAITACSRDEATAPTATLRADRAAGETHRGGILFAATNAAAGNTLLAFARRPDGSLAEPLALPTGGRGTGAGLGNQSGIALSEGGRWVAVVNAGSNEISVFRAGDDGVRRTAIVSSGGTLPVSLTIHGELLYVVNEGSASITGFRLDRDGVPHPIAGSTQALSGAGVDVAQVAFAPDGRQLVVTEKSTNLLLTFPVDAHGVASAARRQASAGATPFGFGFGRHGAVIVSEAQGGAANAGTVSSYDLRHDGALRVVSPAVPTTESAPCWIAVTHDGRFAYTTNAASATITGFGVTGRGMLEVLDADGVTARSDAGPTDMVVTADDDFLYALNGAAGTITAYRVARDGSLAPLGATALPRGANGLAGR